MLGDAVSQCIDGGLIETFARLPRICANSVGWNLTDNRKINRRGGKGKLLLNVCFDFVDAELRGGLFLVFSYCQILLRSAYCSELLSIIARYFCKTPRSVLSENEKTPRFFHKSRCF